MTVTGSRLFGLFALFLALASCARMPIADVPVISRDAIATNLMRDISYLASDELSGRVPGTRGETLTTNYVIDALGAAGFQSGTNDPANAWRAPVRLVSITPSDSRLSLRMGRKTLAFEPESGAAYTSRRRALIEGADVVFVGREADSVDEDQVRGKVVIMLGQPGFSPARREVLFQKQPAAVVTVIETASGLGAVREFYERTSIILAKDENPNVSAFVTYQAMADALGPAEWAELVENSGSQDFAPVQLDGTATIEANSARREFTSYNVIGLLPGQAPSAGSVLLMAHWDHLANCASEDDTDQICNGAVDNASGVAVMLELARRLASSGPYDRDIFIMATTAEESGLLGARAFADAPPVPLDTIVAAFNFDSVAIAPEGSPVGFVGEGRTPLDRVIRQVMAESGRTFGSKSVAEPYLQRQDSWALLQQGVPAVVLSTAFGSEITLGPYLEGRYHRSSDEIEGIELGGAIDDLLLHEELVKRLANTATYPASGG